MTRYGLGIDIGAETVTAAVHVLDDAEPAGPARVLLRTAGRSAEVPLRLVLPRVGDPTPFAGTDESRTAAEQLAAVVAEVREEVGAAQGAAPGHTVVSVPPSWGDFRRATLGAALAEAIGETCTLASSAVAAVRRHHPDTGPGAVAVFDVGAATVDTAVVRPSADGGLEHAAVPPAPLPWGGRDIDDAVLQHVRAAVGFPGPASTSPGRGRTRLVALREACTAAKEQLSSELAVRVDVDLPEGYVRLVRADLDELIAGAVAESVAALRTTVTDAGLAPGDLDGVVLAGGGALVPLVAATLSAELDVPLLVSDEPGLTVACGAAELAADVLTAQPPVTEDEDADEASDEVAVVDLDAYRQARGSRVGVRSALVAALLAVLLVAPLSLMDALHGGVRTRSAPGAAVAGEPSSPAGSVPAAPAEPAAPGEAAAPDVTPAPAGTTAAPAAAPATTAASATSAPAGGARPSSSSAASRPGTSASAPAAPPAAAAPFVTSSPPATQTSTAPPPATQTSAAPPPATQTSSAPPPATQTSAAPPPATQTSSAPPPATQTSAAPPPATETSPAPSDGTGDGGP